MLIQGNCVQLFESKSSGQIEAKAGESLLIKRIEAYQYTGDTDIILKTDRVTVGVYRIEGKAGNHLETIRTASHKFNLMEYLTNQGIKVALPIAEGQSFNFETSVAVDAIMVLFDRYSAGDMKKTDPNGSEAKEYAFMQYMNIGTGLTDSGDALFDTSLSPAEFPDFPCGKVVPAKHTISLLGLIGCPWRDGVDGNKGFYTTHIKLIKDREVLFDPERNGIPFNAYLHTGSSLLYAAGFTLIGSGQFTLGGGHGGQGVPLMFDPPLVFVAGEELNVYAVCTMYGDAPTWTPTAPDLAAILKVRKD